MVHVDFAGIADFCLRRALAIVLASALVFAGSSVYVARHFAINSDVGNLLSPHLAWRQRELAYEAAFPEQATSIIAVVRAPTPEFAQLATRALVARLVPQTDRFRSIDAAQASDFFVRSGLLFLPQDRLAERMDKLSQAAPLISIVNRDQSLRGLASALSTTTYRGNESYCRLRSNRSRFIFPGIGQEVAPGRLPPGCCGFTGPVPSATRDKCLRHAQTL